MIQVMRHRDQTTFESGPGMRLKIMVDGQAGAQNLSAGWITFQPGSKTSNHTRSVEEVIFVARGETVIVSGDEEFVLGEGDSIYIPAGTEHRHENRSAEALEQVWIFAPQGPEEALRQLPKVD